jgi:formylglycine-generating enzyme required for sulfatase activity
MLFCGRCGVKLAAPEVECPNCGSMMPGDAQFCGVCGLGLCPAALSPSPQEVKAAKLPSTASPAAKDPPAEVPAATIPAAEVPAAAPTLQAAAPVSEEAPAQTPRSLDSTDSPKIVVRPLIIEPREAEAEFVSPEKSIREMVLLPAGWFAMGSPSGSGNCDEHPRHQVQLSAYYIDRCAVCNIEYEKFDPRHRRLRPEVADGDHDPVVFVTYYDCLEYCRWREQQEGVAKGTYSLPTEAQWERAARGGSPDRLYSWGNEIILEACNTSEAQRGRTVPVDEGAPNGFGLFHIGSNVREWCLDRYSDMYYGTRDASGCDPAGPQSAMMVTMHVVRGASFQDPAMELGRCAARNYAHPKNSSSDIGFRCVRRHG